MTPDEADAIVEEIFADIRDRGFLKLLLPENPEESGPILHNRRGEPLMPINREIQDEIKSAWREILLAERL